MATCLQIHVLFTSVSQRVAVSLPPQYELTWQKDLMRDQANGFSALRLSGQIDP